MCIYLPDLFLWRRRTSLLNLGHLELRAQMKQPVSSHDVPNSRMHLNGCYMMNMCLLSVSCGADIQHSRVHGRDIWHQIQFGGLERPHLGGLHVLLRPHHNGILEVPQLPEAVMGESQGGSRALSG